MELIGRYAVPQRTREKAFHTWTQTQSKPSGARECFSRGSDSGNGPSLGGDSISCTRRKKTQKYNPSGIGYMLTMAALG